MAGGKAKEVRFVGRCVYGQGPEHAPPLHEGHILAANLGGVLTLGGASCAACQKIINEEIETPCLRGMFREIRYRRSVGSRRVKGRPKELPILKPPLEAGEPLEDTLDIEGWRAKLVPYDHHPSLLVLPIYNTPGLLRGADATVLAAEYPKMWRHIEPHLRDEVDDGGVYVQMKFSHQVFWRLLAKTAHCLAVAHLGVDGFVPFLLDVISGQDVSDRRDIIGCEIPLEKPSYKNNEIRIGVISGSDFNAYIVCSIRFFADLGAPTYHIVAGRKK